MSKKELTFGIGDHKREQIEKTISTIQRRTKKATDLFNKIEQILKT